MPKQRRSATKEVEIRFTRRYKLTAKMCLVCSKTFMGSRKAKYDSISCQQKANYQRHGEAYKARKRENYRTQKERAAKKI